MPQYFCTQLDLAARLSQVGVNLRLDDDPTTLASVQQRATNRVKFYTQHLYDGQTLYNDSVAGGWTNDRAADLGAYYLCTRRGNPAPAAIKDTYQEALDELQLVHADNYQIPGIAQRHHSSPTFSNVRVDPTYTYQKIRTERNISENTPVSGYAQFPEWGSEYFFEY